MAGIFMADSWGAAQLPLLETPEPIPLESFE